MKLICLPICLFAHFFVCAAAGLFVRTFQSVFLLSSALLVCGDFKRLQYQIWAFLLFLLPQSVYSFGFKYYKKVFDMVERMWKIESNTLQAFTLKPNSLVLFFWETDPSVHQCNNSDTRSTPLQSLSVYLLSTQNFSKIILAAFSI